MSEYCDPYAIVTNGIITEYEGSIVVDGMGFFVIVEEIDEPTEPVTDIRTPSKWISHLPDDKTEEKKKFIRLTVKFDQDIPDFTKEYQIYESQIKITDVYFDVVKQQVFIEITNVEDSTQKEIVEISVNPLDIKV